MRWVACGLCCGIALAAFAAQPAPEEAAQHAVDDFHATLLEVRELPAAQDRYERLVPLVSALYDVRGIARFSLGSHWQALNETQREAFTEALGDNISATYANRFGPGGPLAFAAASGSKAARGIVVRADLQTPERQVRLDYFFRRGRIFNVSADGVNDLTLRRAEYSRMLAEESFAALSEHLSAQTRALLAPEH